jgi:nitrate/TMAO reductase-like tetraheme cytochrome c subunit
MSTNNLIKDGRCVSVIILITLGLVLAFGAWISLPGSMQVQAAPAPIPAIQNTTPNDVCLGCHTQPGMTIKMSNGNVLPLTLDKQKYSESIHGENYILCTSCHTTISEFPHPEKTADSIRDFSLENYTTCKQCHQEQYLKTLDSVHQKALAGGNNNAAVCTDCHNPHYQTRLTDPQTGALTPEARVKIPETCARCHSTIYESYKTTVHGSALIGEGNPDVPTCIDCHGVHNISDPTTSEFRLKTPTEMCGRCHTDAKVMTKYGISTNVLNTYVGDFHGTTVIFDQQSPDQGTNKPVCYDCHGIHDIKRVDDPESGIAIKQNLLVKCQRCHGDGIPAGFTDAWLSHYTPSPQVYPLVYFVNFFYLVFIPIVLGGMVIFVVSDIARRIIDRKKKGAAH